MMEMLIVYGGVMSYGEMETFIIPNSMFHVEGIDDILNLPEFQKPRARSREFGRNVFKRQNLETQIDIKPAIEDHCSVCRWNKGKHPLV